MRFFSAKRCTILLFILLFSVHARAQNFSFSCTRDTVIAGCTSTPCFNLRTIAPDIRAASSNYTVSPIVSGSNRCLPN